MALACRFPLNQFLEKIKPYEASLGAYAEQSLRATGKKVKWAVIVEEEVNKFRAIVSAKAISINMLLALHASEALSRLEEKGHSRQEQLVGTLEEQRTVIKELKGDTQSVRDNLESNRRSAAREAEALRLAVHSRFDGLDQQTTRIAHELSALSIDMASNARSLICLRHLGAQMMNFIRSFPAELRELLRKIIQGNLHNFQTLLAIQNSLAACPSQLNSSNIHFEDALGVVRMLPYEWFRYWEARLSLL